MILNIKLFLNRLLILSVMCIVLYPNIIYAEGEKNEEEKKLIDYTIYENKDVYNLNGEGSMMYSKEDLLKLYNLLKKSKARSSGTNYPDLKEIKKEEEVIEKEVRIIPNSQNFFLDSILYYNDESWSIWINKSKTSSKSIQDNPKVVKVSENNVTMVWQNLDLAKTSPNWKNDLEHIAGTFEKSNVDVSKEQTEKELEKIRKKKKAVFDAGEYEWNYKSKDGIIKLDSKNNIIEFNLKLHQTFIGHNLFVAEGLVEQRQQVDQNMLNNKKNIDKMDDNALNEIKEDTDDSSGNNNEFDNLVNDIFNDPNL